MKKQLLCMLSATLPLLIVSAAQADIDLRISEIWMGNENGENLSEDWIEITNYGTTPWVSGTDADLYYDDDSADPSTADLITGIADIQPGESAIVLITDATAAIEEFVALWSPVYNLDGVEVGLCDGSGLGGSGDAATLFFGGPADDTIVSYEAYPDAGDFGGQSWDAALGGFSIEGEPPYEPVATVAVNDEGEDAVASPGNLGPAYNPGNIPEISLLGEGALTLTAGDIFTDPGAVATDIEDGDLSASIVVGGDIVETSTVGEYTLTYDVTDSDGNAAVQAVRTVTVTYPETIPTPPVPIDADMFHHTATLGDLPGAEIPAYDAKTAQAYVTGGDGLQIVSLADPSNPTPVTLLDPSAPPFNLSSPAVTSVDSCDGVVAFAVPSDPTTENGAVIFTDVDGTLLRTVTVGAQPDMVTFTPNCRKVLVANKGEPGDDADPEGTVSIIDVKNGKVRTVDFSRFNGTEDALRARGIRIFPDVAAATDFEPEYIAVNRSGRTAMVTLQEANALAEIDLRRAAVIRILPLGLKDHTLPGNALDASDKDGVTNIQNWPLFGMYMPDAIASYRVWGMDFYITANEGENRGADERVKKLDLDETAFPDADALQSDFNIGRIEVSTIDGDLDGDGDYDALYTYGARSFSIWTQNGTQVYDSGSDIEAIVATYSPETADDGRSDNKGPEPEGAEIGVIRGRIYAFIGLERTHNILVYDVSVPFAPQLVQVLIHEGDDAPEGLKFIPDHDSPTRQPMLLVTNEESSTLTIYEADLRRCRR